jgi:hypothetical protein
MRSGVRADGINVRRRSLFEDASARPRNHVRIPPLAVLCVALAAPTVAAADDNENVIAGVDVSIVGKVATGDKQPDVSGLGLVGAHILATSGGGTARYAFALDLGIGGTADEGGVAYDLQILPVGVGLQIRRPEHTTFVGVAAGVGASGAVSSLAFAATLPVQGVAVVRLGHGYTIAARGRVSVLLNDTVRGRIEEDASLAVQSGTAHDYIDGDYVGVAYRHLEGAQFVGLVIGYGFAFGDWSSASDPNYNH